MKRSKSSVFLAFILIIFHSCRIDKPEKYSVDLLSATIQRDGSVRMEGKVNETEKEIQYVGFWFTDNSKENAGKKWYTLASEFKGNRFMGIFGSQFEKTNTCYFKTYVHYGAQQIPSSNTISLDNIDSISGCLNQDNTVSCGVDERVDAYSIKSGSLNANTGIYEMRCSTNFGPSVELRFGSAIKAGEYKTVEKLPDAGTMDVYVYFSFASDPALHVLNAGSTISVNKKASGAYEIIICNTDWKQNSGIYRFNSKIILD